MKITRLDKTEKTKVNMEGAEGAYKQVPISRDDKSPNFSFRVFTLEPGGHTPYHTHPNEHINYLIQGDAAIVTESGEELEFKTGDFALVLPDEKHQYKNKSATELMIMICAVPKEYE